MVLFGKVFGRRKIESNAQSLAKWHPLQETCFFCTKVGDVRNYVTIEDLPLEFARPH